MPDKFKIATAVLAAVVAYDARITLTRIKPAVKRLIESNDSLLEMNSALYELLEESMARSAYLASVIDKHEIELDAFDEIAIINPL